jgi:CubicO group peptidase (beta-lactamase class C family)
MRIRILAGLRSVPIKRLNDVFCFVAIFAIFLLSACSTSPHLNFSRELSPVSKKIDDYLKAGVPEGFSGAVLIAKNDLVLLKQGYGFASKEAEIANSPETVFTIGSVTKQFTAAAILLLSDQYDLDLNSSITEFFPNLPDDKADITLHQLLTHTSGLPSDIGEGDFDYIPTEEYFARLFESKLLVASGTKHHYSNAGYSVLARIIEICSGQDYESFLAAKIFLPLGMKHTGYVRPSWKDKDIAQGYMRNIINRGTLIERFNASGAVSWNLKGNGGIHSTLNDMYIWHQALKNNTVLSASQLKMLTTPYVPESESLSSHYAYGWAIFKSNRETKIISHNGGNGVFFFDYIWIPEEDTTVLFATNASSREVELAWQIEKMLFSETYLPKPIEKNVYHYVFDFIENSPTSNIAKLETALLEQYSEEISDPGTLNRLGYLSLRSETKSNWSVPLFTLNTRLFPTDSNVWDSLGDAYQTHGKINEAIKTYRKAIMLGHKGADGKLKELLDDVTDQ